MLNARARPEPEFQPEYEDGDDGPEGTPGGNQNDPQRILRTVLSAAPPVGIPVSEIIIATGMSRRWVLYRLQQMAAEGLAVQVAHGLWRAARERRSWTRVQVQVHASRVSTRREPLPQAVHLHSRTARPLGGALVPAFHRP